MSKKDLWDIFTGLFLLGGVSFIGMAVLMLLTGVPGK